MTDSECTTSESNGREMTPEQRDMLPMPMAMVIEGTFTDQANLDSFPRLLEDMKQILATRNDIDPAHCHVFIRGSAEQVIDCVTQIHEESD